MRSTTGLVGGMEDSKSLPCFFPAFSRCNWDVCFYKLPLTSFYHSFKTVTHQMAGLLLWFLHCDGGDGEAESHVPFTVTLFWKQQSLRLPHHPESRDTSLGLTSWLDVWTTQRVLWNCPWQQLLRSSSFKAFPVRVHSTSFPLNTGLYLSSPTVPSTVPSIWLGLGKCWLNWVELETEIDHMFKGCIGAWRESL